MIADTRPERKPSEMREATLRHKLRLPEEPEFALTDGFVTTLRRKPERAFEAVGGEVTPEVAGDQVGTKSKSCAIAPKNGQSANSW